MLAELTISAVILFAMICVSWYGWVTLPADARVPIHFGVSYNNFVPKRLGLVMHPAVGALLYVVLTVASHGSSAHGGSSWSAPLIILPVATGLLLAVQVGAIRVARHRAGP